MRVERFELQSAGAEDGAALAACIRGLVRPPAGIGQAVAEILEDVRLRGDEAVAEWTRRFDPGRHTPGYADRDDVAAQLDRLEPVVREALEQAVANVQETARAELSDSTVVDLPQGQRVEVRELPVRRAGIYVPAGRAAYPSTVVMCTVPARVAGVDELIVMTQPASEDARRLILAACALCEVDRVYFAAGVQAIAALAFGTETIEPVDVIAGPGNAYVQEAKRQVAGAVGIDGVEGPSELVVVAGDEADAGLVALDLAAQGEHGSETLLVLATPSETLLDAVAAEVSSLAADRPSVADAPVALVRTASIGAALELANAIAPEHLELATEDAEAQLSLVRAAGAVFLGRNGGAAFGDYVAGSNHVLPTGGAARFAGPLGVSTFRRRQALVSLPDSAVQRLAPLVGALARAEGFPVHAASAEARSQSSPNPRSA